MVFYVVYAQDNDTYAYRDRPAIREDTDWYELHQTLFPDVSGQSRPGLQRCPTCGELLAKWDESLAGIKIKKSQLDVSCTYDGVLIVSAAFKNAYDVNGMTGLNFRRLPDSPSFYDVQATRIVEFDAERRRTRFLNQCASCRRYESAVGATPVYLKPGAVIGAKEFVRTDLEFGTGDEKHPLILCGQSAGAVLEKAALKGLDLLHAERSLAE